jgi:sugar phosphate isomerase/epimerase
LKKSGKSVIFSAQPVQLSHREDMIDETDISSIDEKMRKLALKRIYSLIDEAYGYGAESFAFISGRDVKDEKLRNLAKNALITSIHEMCEYSDNTAEKLGIQPMKLIIEQFDRINEPGFKNQLVGPSIEAIDIAKQVRFIYRHLNFGLMYDLSHMLIINDESGNAETADVLRGLAPYLMHVHIGSCVTQKEDAKYGDSHVSFNYKNSAVTKDMLADFVMVLEEIGYEGIIGFEVTPLKDDVSESVISIHKAYFEDPVEAEEYKEKVISELVRN